jgi:hypothetical protein
MSQSTLQRSSRPHGPNPGRAHDQPELVDTPTVRWILGLTIVAPPILAVAAALVGPPTFSGFGAVILVYLTTIFLVAHVTSNEAVSKWERRGWLASFLLVPVVAQSAYWWTQLRPWSAPRAGNVVS